MAFAAIALGSNLPGTNGSREANLEGAVAALRQVGHVQATSNWYDTDPVGYAGQPRFLNGAALMQTDLAPEALLVQLLRIEQQFGRDRSHGIEQGPRTLDLDLLFYDDRVVRTPTLVVPHPTMHERRFVLEPLAEIAPDWHHPVLHRSVRDLLAGVS